MDVFKILLNNIVFFYKKLCIYSVRGSYIYVFRIEVFLWNIIINGNIFINDDNFILFDYVYFYFWWFNGERKNLNIG